MGLVACCLSVVFSSCAVRDDQSVITIFAAASTMDAVTQVLDSYRILKPENSVVLRPNFASSSSLAMLLVRGVKADIFLSANEEWADRVQANSKVSCERVDLLGNRLVLITACTSDLEIAGVEDLVSSGVRRIAIADPFSVPAGIYAREVFQHHGIWKQLEPNVAATADVRRAMALVEQGAAEVGVVYATDASISDGVKVLLEFPTTTTPVVYPLLHFKHEPQPEVVADLYRFFTSVEAREIFRQHGFCVLSETVGEVERGN